MKTQKREFGDFGESIACKFLVKHGFSILDRNYLKPWGEIDIVSRKINKIFFFEVKTVTVRMGNVAYETNDAWAAEENIHPAKLSRLSRTIQTYIAEKNIESDWEVGALIVEVNRIKNTAKVRFVEDIL